MNWAFLNSNRFWVLVIGCATIVINEGFTFEAWMKAISALCLGFITIRTIDRAADKVSG